MKRKTLVIVLVLALMLALLAGAALAARAVAPSRLPALLIANGQVLQAPAYRHGGTLYLPLRAAAEAFGLEVSWQNEPAAALVKTPGEEHTVTVLIGEDNILIGQSTYVPMFFFTSDAYGLTVSVRNHAVELSGTVDGSKKDVYREYPFDKSMDGFEPIFADYYIDGDGLEKYEMSSDYKRIPVTGAESSGPYIASKNLSDDIIMGFVKEISGLKANTEYKFTVGFKLATGVEGGLIGVGGSPGESVFVKAGVAAEYPKLGTAEDGAQRIVNVDTGVQSQDGRDLVVVGDVSKPEGAPEGFVFKHFGVQCTATTDAQGRAFLIIATDSGFEGFTEWYLANVTVLCGEQPAG